MEELVSDLEALLGEMSVSKDLAQLIYEETDSVPRTVKEVYNDAARSAWLLGRLQTLIGVCYDRLFSEIGRLEEIFEKMYKALHPIA